MPWYTLQVRTGYESKIVREIEKKIEEEKLQNVKEVFCPEETVESQRNGKTYERKVKIYANYIWIDMEYSEKNWHELTKISGVNGFVGDKSKPAITPAREIEVIKTALADKLKPPPQIEFFKDEKVRIKDGPFKDYIGQIKDVDMSKNKANVIVTIFGRETPVETLLDTLDKVEKV